MAQNTLLKSSAVISLEDKILEGTLPSRLKKAEIKNATLKSKRDDLNAAIARQESEIEQKNELAMLMTQANILLQYTSQHKRDVIVKQIQDIGTFALKFVLGDQMSLRVEMKDMSSKAGVMKAEFYAVERLANGDEVVRTPEDNYAGGIVDVISTALRLAMLQIYEPEIDGPILLDEPGKHVSEEYTERFCLFLKEMSRQFGRQIILITHNTTLAESADNKIAVSRKEGEPSEVVCNAQ